MTQKEAVSKAQEIVPDYTVVAGLRKTKILELTRRMRDIDEQMKVWKAERDELKELGVKLFIKAEVKSAIVDGWRVTRVDGQNVSISRGKLFELGVSEKILEKATNRVPFTTLKLTPPGVKE